MNEPNYQIVEFIGENTAHEKTVDIVPCDWIRYDEGLQSLATTFMLPPYDEETAQTLYSLVRYCMPAPEYWATFPIKLRGQAKNYKEASRKLKELTSMVSMFTSDIEMSPEQRAPIAHEKFLRGNRQLETLHEDWNVRTNPIEIRQVQTKYFPSQWSSSPGLPSMKESAPELQGTVNNDSTMDVILSDCPPFHYEKLMSEKKIVSDTDKTQSSRPIHVTMNEPKYQIVEFIGENTAHQKTVDIVPCDWIRYDEGLQSLATTFMLPPYDEETAQTLYSLVRYCMPAPGYWATFPIKLRGQAKNYKEASRKLKELTSTVSMFTSDIDMLPEQRAPMANEKFLRGNRQLETLHVDWNVRTNPIEPRQVQTKYFPSQWSSSPGLPSMRESASELQGTVINDSTMDVILSHCPPLHYEKLMSDITEEIKKTIKESLVPIEKHIKELSREICCLRADIGSLKSDNIQQPDFSSRQDHGFRLPLKGQKEFEDFDDILQSDEGCNEKIKWFIWQNVDSSGPLVESLRRVLKIFLTREVIEGYTAVKDTHVKKVFVQTHFFAELQSILIRKYERNNKSISRKDIEKALGRIFNAAKDWDGARQARTKTARE